MIKLVLSDMDNTLIPLGEKHVSPRTIAAIHELMETGVRFGPATGRDTIELLRFFDMDESCFMTGILSNGKRIRLDGSYVQMTLIPRDALERIDAALRPEPGMFLVCYPEQTNLLYPAYGVGTTDEALAYYARRTRFTGIAVDQIPDEDYIAATIACPEDPEHMERCRQIVAEAAPDMRIASPISGWFDIMPQGVSKAAGARRPSRRAGHHGRRGRGLWRCRERPRDPAQGPPLRGRGQRHRRGPGHRQLPRGRRHRRGRGRRAA